MDVINAHTHAQVHLEYGKLWHENGVSTFCRTNSIEMGNLKRHVPLNDKVEHKTPQEGTINPYKVRDPAINLNMFIVWPP